MNPSWRKPAGALAILGLILVWIVLVTSIAPKLGAWWWPLELIFYMVTGIIWIMPLKPLLLWMETGRWRV